MKSELQKNNGRRITDWATTWKDGCEVPSFDRRGCARTGSGTGRRWSDQAVAKIAFASAALALGSAAYATNGTQTLSMSVGGNIYTTPSWQVNGSAGTTATYTFTAFGTGTLASASVSLMVLNPSTLGGDSLTLTLPTGCKVGSTAVGAVNFIQNGTTQTANGAVASYANFTDGTPVATQIQFTGVTSSGAVTCTTSGALAYTY